jgi:hypothetical protein
VALFERVGLRTNTAKTKAMINYPSHISGAMTAASYDRRMTGQGMAPALRAKQVIACPAPGCTKSYQRKGLKAHMNRSHGLEPPDPMGLDRLRPPDPPAAFTCEFPPVCRPIPCPVPGCAHDRVANPLRMRYHFQCQHVQHTITVKNEGAFPLTRCGQCHMFVTTQALARGHQTSESCRRMTASRVQQESLEAIRLASEVTFTAYGTALETVSCFPYLGRPLSCCDNDWPAIYRNLKKARGAWARLSHLLKRDGASPKVSGNFYKAVVQSVLLFGSESWVMSPAIYKALDGFHHRVARRIAGMLPRLTDGDWVTPPVGPALEAAGLRSFCEYVEARQRHVVEYVAQRPIMELCRAARGIRGSHLGKLWWQQAPIADMLEEQLD